MYVKCNLNSSIIFWELRSIIRISSPMMMLSSRGVFRLRASLRDVRIRAKDQSCVRSKIQEKSSLGIERYTPLLIGASLLAVHQLVFSGDASANEALGMDGHDFVPHEVYRIAENEDFWANMARYGRFFFSVIVGTVYTALKPLSQLLKRPVTAAVIIGVAVLIYFFVSTTLQAMLGLSDFDYSLY